MVLMIWFSPPLLKFWGIEPMTDSEKKNCQ